PFDKPLFGVIGVDRTQLRLHAAAAIDSHLIMRLIKVAVQADHGTSVDKAGSYDLCIDHAVIRRNGHLGRGSDSLDLAVVNKNDAVSDGLAGHRPDRFTFNGDLSGRRLGSEM